MGRGVQGNDRVVRRSRRLQVVIKINIENNALRSHGGGA